MSRLATETIYGQGVTEVVFRRKGVVSSLIKLVLLVGGWLLAGGFAAMLLLAGGGREPLFTMGWLGLWAVGGGGFILAMIWSAFGSERVMAYPDRLVLERRLLLAGARSQFPAQSINDLRWLADDPSRKVRVNGRRIPQTGMELRANGSIVRFARGVGEREARQAIASIQQRIASARRRAA